ncbi:hypothetical protein [Oscillatoria sp. FACHB-1407]|nr:hypothetical protein [Oscillatoria sp. FACHB-1407]
MRIAVALQSNGRGQQLLVTSNSALTASFNPLHRDVNMRSH